MSTGDIGVSELVAGAVLGSIAWVISRATGAHLDSLRALGARIEALTAEVAGMRAELRAVNERQAAVERRLERLEHEERQRP